MLANLPVAGVDWTAGYAAGLVAVDADHLPLVPIRHKILKQQPRPSAHALLAPAGLSAAAAFTRGRAREAIRGLAAGTWAHFLRDLATGGGLSPLQPLTRWRVKLPYTAYVATMLLLCARAWRLPR